MDSKDKLITELHTQLIEKEQEINKLKEEKRKTIEYVSKLSSKGRDCEIYYDIKKEILNLLGGNNE